MNQINFLHKQFKGLWRFELGAFLFLFFVNIGIISFFLYLFYDVYQSREIRQNFILYVLPTIVSLQFILLIFLGPIALIFHLRFRFLRKQLKELDSKYLTIYEGYTKIAIRKFAHIPNYLFSQKGLIVIGNFKKLILNENQFDELKIQRVNYGKYGKKCIVKVYKNQQLITDMVFSRHYPEEVEYLIENINTIYPFVKINDVKYYIFMSKILTFFLACFTFVFYNCKAQIEDPIPDHQTIKLDSKILGEQRMVNIWLPSDYETSKDSLTVLYMLDGGIQEDFPHVANTLNELISSKKIKPIILVGVENIQRRKDLTPPTSVEKDKEIAPIVGKSEDFRKFLKDELMPKINETYRTTSKKGIIGESLAGLFVTETLLIQPDLFDFYIAFDPSLWWNNSNYVKNVNNYLLKDYPTKKVFWFAGSKAKDISVNTKNLVKSLENQQSKNLVWKYSDQKKETHQTIFRATKNEAIIWTLNNL